MQYVWQHRLWLPSDMVTVDGTAVEVIDPGLLNTNSGPDFFNAKIRIDGRTWVGNIEIHVKASDWHRHGHQTDPAYDNVILHVVQYDDMRIARRNGDVIPQIVMSCASDFSIQYHRMVNNNDMQPSCASELKTLPHIFITDWLDSLAFERLYSKADRVESYLQRFENSWRDATYILLARGLGFSTNSDAFERLATITPLKALLRHQGDTSSIEAMLFGQAGLLDATPGGEVEAAYLNSLRRDYAFLSTKYKLHPPLQNAWRMARMRPQNFPHRRIALMAELISRGFLLGYNVFNITTVEHATSLLNVPLRGFWQTHYTFGGPSQRCPEGLSTSSIQSLIINVVVPLLYSYGTTYGKDELQEKAISLLQELPAEENVIVRQFKSAGIECTDAFTSQALIELRRCYCDTRKCLYCRLGHRFLAGKAILRPSIVSEERCDQSSR